MLTGLCLFVVLAVALIACHKSGLRRISSNQVLGGVCSGIAAQTNLEPNLVRVLAALALLLTGGFVLLLYVLLWITLPKD